MFFWSLELGVWNFPNDPPPRHRPRAAHLCAPSLYLLLARPGRRGLACGQRPFRSPTQLRSDPRRPALWQSPFHAFLGDLDFGAAADRGLPEPRAARGDPRAALSDAAAREWPRGRPRTGPRLARPGVGAGGAAGG